MVIDPSAGDLCKGGSLGKNRSTAGWDAGRFLETLSETWMTEEQRELVLHLIRVGDYSDAVAAYQEETGADEDTAASAVAALADRHGLKRAGGIGWQWIALALSLAAGAGWLITVAG